METTHYPSCSLKVFHQLLGVNKEDFEALSADEQLDVLYDTIDDLCLVEDWIKINHIYENYDPEDHPLFLTCGMLTLGAIIYQNGVLPVWRATYHRIRSHLKKNPDAEALLKGFPTGSIAEELGILEAEVFALKKKVENFDCRYGDNLTGDYFLGKILCKAVEHLEAVQEVVKQAGQHTRRQYSEESLAYVEKATKDLKIGESIQSLITTAKLQTISSELCKNKKL